MIKATVVIILKKVACLIHYATKLSIKPLSEQESKPFSCFKSVKFCQFSTLCLQQPEVHIVEKPQLNITNFRSENHVYLASHLKSKLIQLLYRLFYQFLSPVM